MFLAAILLVPTLSVHATERDGMTEEKAVEIAENMKKNIDASQKQPLHLLMIMMKSLPLMTVLWILTQ